MTRLFVHFTILVSLMIGVGCVRKAPTSPTFEYAGEWQGKWIDYGVYNVNTGNPASGPLSLTVEKDGTASASGTIHKDIGGISYYDRIYMDLTVLPDGLITGTGEWGLNFTGYTLGGVGEVRGQLDADSKTGSGALLVEINDSIWHFPWEVSQSK